MDLRPLTDEDKKKYNSLVTHIVQSWEWGEFRKSLGLPLLRYGLFEKGKLKTTFQLTLHKIPFTNKFVGYLPKGPFPDKDLAQALAEIGKRHNCITIKVEPNIEISSIHYPAASIDKRFKISPKPMFTKHNFILDLTRSEDQILKNMHPKTRYNIRVAQRYGVWVEERADEEALDIYLKLYFETTKRQGYFGHNESYHRLVWKTLKKAGMAKLVIAFYKPSFSARLQLADKPEGLTATLSLAAWMLLSFGDTIYYPYGGSSEEYKNTMASTLLAWEAIRSGKKSGAKKFDFWGALGPNADPRHPFYGFHNFKAHLGAELVEYLGSFDLVFNYPLYLAFTQVDKLTPLKAFLLKVMGK